MDKFGVTPYVIQKGVGGNARKPARPGACYFHFQNILTDLAPVNTAINGNSSALD